MRALLVALLVAGPALADGSGFLVSPMTPLPMPGTTTNIASRANMPTPTAPSADLIDPLLFDVNFSSSGPSLLPTTFALAGGAQLELVCAFDGSDANASTWPGTGDTLSIAGTGTDPTVGMPSAYLDDARGVQFRSGKYYEGSSSSACDVGAEDFVFEVVFRAAYDGALNDGIVAKRGVSSPNAGWTIQQNNATTVRLILDDGPDTALPTVTITPDATNYVGGYVNRSTASTDGARLAANGGGLGSGADPSAIDALTSPDPMRIGFGSGADPYSGRVIAVRLWRCPLATPGCLTDGAPGATEMEGLFAERAARLEGLRATIARGSPMPTTKARASVAYADKIDVVHGTRRLFPVGAGHLRLARRKELTGGEYVSGILVESQSTNLLLQSQAFGTTWSLVDAGDSIAADTELAPDDTVTADAIVGDATDGGHGVTQAVTITATTYTLSVWALAGTHDWLYLSDDTVANATGYVDLATCTAGTAGAGTITLTADPWSYDSDFDGDADLLWCRASISFTGTAGSHTMRIEAADDAGDHSTVGDGASEMVVLWQAQVEAQVAASSPIVTTTASATRPADDLRYSGTNNANPSAGSLVVDILSSRNTFTAETLAQVGASSGDANSVLLSVNSSDVCRLNVLDAGGGSNVITGTSDVTNGERRTCRATWAVDDVRLYVDGTSEGMPDTSATPPTSFSQIFVGETRTGAFQLGGVLDRLRIYDRAIPGSVSAP